VNGPLEDVPRSTSYVCALVAAVQDTRSEYADTFEYVARPGVPGGARVVTDAACYCSPSPAAPVATTRYQYVVPCVRPESCQDVAARPLARTVNGPAAAAARCTV
jgi:hypothetical protein